MWVLIVLGVLILFVVGFFVFAVGTITMEKPVIYLYPEEESRISVQLQLNGKVTQAIPKYERGWNVFVTKDGLIDGKYDYLFYEADLNTLKLPKRGWVVSFDDLSKWFDLNLIKLGLNEKEKTQFKEYWMVRLPETNYYEIKVLESDFLIKNMNLLITPVPDTLIRLNFYFKPLLSEKSIKEPTIRTLERKGFTVVEWGGMVDN